MVTILDFNPTKEEYEAFVGDFTREEAAAMSSNSQMAMIGELLWSRGETEEAKRYIEQIDDEQFKLDVYRSVTHPTGKTL